MVNGLRMVFSTLLVISAGVTHAEESITLQPENTVATESAPVTVESDNNLVVEINDEQPADATLLDAVGDTVVETDNETVEQTQYTSDSDSTPIADDNQLDNAIRYSCSLNGLVRRVELNYLTPPAVLPCEVNYYKDVETPGTVQTLWSALSNEGYCEAKTEAFIEKLSSWGWNCTIQ